MINAIAIDDEPFALQIIEMFCNKIDFIHLQKTFTKPTQALIHLNDNSTDLIFVDIKMPAMSGISLVKELPPNTMVIFTTAFSNYAVESYELNAIDYLLKPINFNRFNQAVNKANEYLNYLNKKDQIGETYIFIRADFSLIKIPIGDILYIEGLADYLKIYIKDRKTVIARMTMREIMEKLPTPDFIRVHRSFIIPFNRIHSVRNNNIALPEREIPIGKTYINFFFSLYDV